MSDPLTEIKQLYFQATRATIAAATSIAPSIC